MGTDCTWIFKNSQQDLIRMKEWNLMLWGNVISIDQTHVHGNTLDEEIHHVPVETGTTIELARKYD